MTPPNPPLKKEEVENKKAHRATAFSYISFLKWFIPIAAICFLLGIVGIVIYTVLALQHVEFLQTISWWTWLLFILLILVIIIISRFSYKRITLKRNNLSEESATVIVSSDWWWPLLKWLLGIALAIFVLWGAIYLYNNNYFHRNCSKSSSTVLKTCPDPYPNIQTVSYGKFYFEKGVEYKFLMMGRDVIGDEHYFTPSDTTTTIFSYEKIGQPTVYWSYIVTKNGEGPVTYRLYNNQNTNDGTGGWISIIASKSGYVDVTKNPVLN